MRSRDLRSCGRRVLFYALSGISVLALVVVGRSIVFKECFAFQNSALRANAGTDEFTLKRKCIGIFWSEGRFAFGSLQSTIHNVSSFQAQRQGYNRSNGNFVGLSKLYDGEHAILGLPPGGGPLRVIGITAGGGGYSSPQLQTTFWRLRLPAWLVLLVLAFYPIRVAWMKGRWPPHRHGFPVDTGSNEKGVTTD